MPEDTKPKLGIKFIISSIPADTKLNTEELGLSWDDKKEVWFTNSNEAATKARSLAEAAGEVKKYYVREDAPKETYSELRNAFACHFDYKKQAWYHYNADKRDAADAFVAKAIESHKNNHELGKIAMVPEIDHER